jgi:choline dehydrogenase
MYHYGSVPFDMNTARWGCPTSENAFCLTPNVTRAKSRDTVRLRTRDYRDKPMVDPRYFTHEHDVRVMTYGLKLARKIAAQPALAAGRVRSWLPARTSARTTSCSTTSTRPATPSTTRPAP